MKPRWLPCDHVSQSAADLSANSVAQAHSSGYGHRRLSAELGDPAPRLRCPESLLLRVPPQLLLLLPSDRQRRSREEEESTKSTVASARDGVASDGRQEHGYSACSAASCGARSCRTPGRPPTLCVFCPLGAEFSPLST